MPQSLSKSGDTSQKPAATDRPTPPRRTYGQRVVDLWETVNDGNPMHAFGLRVLERIKKPGEKEKKGYNLETLKNLLGVHDNYLYALLERPEQSVFSPLELIYRIAIHIGDDPVELFGVYLASRPNYVFASLRGDLVEHTLGQETVFAYYGRFKLLWKEISLLAGFQKPRSFPEHVKLTQEFTRLWDIFCQIPIAKHELVVTLVQNMAEGSEEYPLFVQDNLEEIRLISTAFEQQLRFSPNELAFVAGAFYMLWELLIHSEVFGSATFLEQEKMLEHFNALWRAYYRLVPTKRGDALEFLKSFMTKEDPVRINKAHRREMMRRPARPAHLARPVTKKNEKSEKKK